MSCEMLAADFSGRKMTKTTLTSRFLAGFEPIVLPPRGPDGLIPSGPPRRSLPVLHPSLCEAGPCRNFHRIASVLDAQEPIAIPGVQGGGPVRRQVTRACYPTPGIEIELGEEPVLQCSRWEPDGEQERLDGIRSRYMRSAPGKAFAEQVAKFEESAASEASGKRASEFEADAEALVAETSKNTAIDVLEDLPAGSVTIREGDATWHDGPGWYYTIDDYPDEGSCGAFASRVLAEQHARAAGHTVTNGTVTP